MLLFYVLVFWPRGMWDLSSLTRDRTCSPCTGRQSLNRWATREVPLVFIFKMRKLRPREPVFWTPGPQVPISLGCFLTVLSSFAVRETEAQRGDISEDWNPQPSAGPSAPSNQACSGCVGSDSPGSPSQLTHSLTPRDPSRQCQRPQLCVFLLS